MSTLSVAPVAALQQPGGLPNAANNQAVASSPVPTGDSYSISQAAAALLAAPATTPAASSSQPAADQNAATDSDPVQAFEQAQAPPPYTLHDFQPNPNRDNARALARSGFTAFQSRQFTDLLKTIRSITSAVLPNFSYSA